MSLAEADPACASAAVCPEIAVLRTKTVTGQIGQLVFLFMKNAKGSEKYGLAVERTRDVNVPSFRFTHRHSDVHTR